ncbi:MAG TPA: DoxX family protein [Ktedonobacteraceae bacterium]
MFLAYIILAILRTGLIGFSCFGKIRRTPRVMRTIVEAAQVPIQWLPWLAAIEIAGALGILIGIAWAPLGIAAASGLVLYFVGAIIAHGRAGDFKGMLTPVGPLLFSAAVLVTRILAS